MRKFNDPGNKILDTITNPNPPGKVFGQVEGFIVTTFFSKSRNISVDKAMVRTAWRCMKTDPLQRYLRDSHNTDVPPVGYTKAAYLVENDDFLGIYIKADILDLTTWKKFENGEYKGFSAAFGRKLSMNNEVGNHKKAIEIVVEKNSYSDEQLKFIKSSFPSDAKVVINETMRFSEVPSQIININVFLNVQYLLQTIWNYPVESGVATVGVMVLTAAIDAFVKDLYSFLKKGAKTLFGGKLMPRVVAKNSIMNQDIRIKIEAKTAKDMKEAAKLLNETYAELITGKKLKIQKAKKISFERKNKKWQLVLEN